MIQNPKISIIIPVLNGEKTLSLCLESLSAMDYPQDKYEIIVVDNGSTDNTPNIIKKYPVICINEQKKGRAQARNAGIKQAKGEFIVFIDADCVADKNWLKKLMKSCDSLLITVCDGPVCDYKNSGFLDRYINSLEVLKNNNYKNRILLEGTDTLLAANCIYRKSLFNDVGLFDEAFKSIEDSELYFRLILKGKLIAHASEAIVYHNRRHTFFYFCKRTFENGRYGAAFVYKYRKHKNISGLSYLVVFKKFLKSIINRSAKGVFNKIVFLAIHIILLPIRSLGWLSFYVIKPKNIKVFNEPINFSGKVFRKCDESIIINDINRSCTYEFNESASRIWELFCLGKNEKEITEILANEYNVDTDNLASDVVSFIEKLKTEELIYK